MANVENLTPGNPGNRGGGRPPDAWKSALRELASKDSTLNHVRAVLEAGPDHVHFFRALQYATEHGFGKAAQSVDMTTKGEPICTYIVIPPEEAEKL